MCFFEILKHSISVFGIVASLALICDSTVRGQDNETPPDAQADVQKDADSEQEQEPAEEQAPNVDFSGIDGQFRDLKPLSKESELWFSTTDNIVLIGGKVCLNQGQLEMFACTPRTKEHESIVVVSCRAFEIHAALLAIGAKTGRPVSYDPDYTPATGSEIMIDVHWYDDSGKAKKVAAQEWIRNTKTQEQMKHSWVFAGSGFYHDADRGQNFYLAEGGEVFCVSNFTTALLDLPIKSSDMNDGLMFEAFEGRIPPRGTPVRMVLRVKEAEKSDNVENKQDEAGNKKSEADSE